MLYIWKVALVDLSLMRVIRQRELFVDGFVSKKSQVIMSNGLSVLALIKPLVTFVRKVRSA